jgi:hypothetical protein
MDLRFRLDGIEYLDILKKYFDVSLYVEENNIYLEIHEEYEGSSGIFYYSSEESGRILVMIYTEYDYDGLLLFSPLGILETWSTCHPFEVQMLGMITEKIIYRNIRFRNGLVGNLCETRRKFNSSFRILFSDADFDFFIECEAIAEINPFCMNRDEFKDLSAKISLALNSFNKTKVETLLGYDSRGSIDALRKVFQRIGKIHDVNYELKDLSVIHEVRNTVPFHSTDKYFANFLKRFDKKYPEEPGDWCDLSIFILQRTSKIVDKLSSVLVQ